MEILILLGGAVIVLVTATAVAWRLEARHGATETLSNLKSRIYAWWIMVGVLAIVFLVGRTLTILLFALNAALVLREFLAVAEDRPQDRLARTLAYTIVLPFQFYLIWWDWYGLFSVFIPVYVFFLLPVVMAATGGPDNILSRLTVLQWGLMVSVYGLSHVPALANLAFADGSDPFLLIAFLVIVVQASDVAQYIWGKLYGRRKLAPVLSPSKTWEGFLGGVATASLLGGLLWWLTPFGFFGAVLMALVAALMGVAGGLALSAIKRDRGVKDWGAGIAGHGGFLDRLDSLVFSAPIFFHLSRWFWSTV